MLFAELGDRADKVIADISARKPAACFACPDARQVSEVIRTQYAQSETFC